MERLKTLAIVALLAALAGSIALAASGGGGAPRSASRRASSTTGALNSHYSNARMVSGASASCRAAATSPPTQP